MTVARRIIPGTCYALARRITQRLYFLTPDARGEIEEDYLYCLATAANTYNITLYGWVAMSNHEHLVVRDNEGNLPEFLCEFHKDFAKVMNARLGRWENFWASEQTSVVELVEPLDGLDKLIYLLANPVAAHLVDRVSDWPGACSFRQHLSGKPRTLRRPRRFFREDGPMPSEITIQPAKLPGYEHLSDAEYANLILGRVREAEARARREREEKGIRVLGRKGVLRTNPNDSPNTIAPRRKLRPCIACRAEERRKYELKRLVEFRATRTVMLERHLAGEPNIVFPYGTYRIRGFLVCAPPPTPALCA